LKKILIACVPSNPVEKQLIVEGLPVTGEAVTLNEALGIF